MRFIAPTRPACHQNPAWGQGFMVMILCTNMQSHHHAEGDVLFGCWTEDGRKQWVNPRTRCVVLDTNLHVYHTNVELVKKGEYIVALP